MYDLELSDLSLVHPPHRSPEYAYSAGIVVDVDYLPNFNTSLFEDVKQSGTTCSAPAHSSINTSFDPSGSIGSARFISLSNRVLKILVQDFQMMTLC